MFYLPLLWFSQILKVTNKETLTLNNFEIGEAFRVVRTDLRAMDKSQYLIDLCGQVNSFFFYATNNVTLTLQPMI